MSDHATILHGPRLSPFQAQLGYRTRPATWSTGARVTSDIMASLTALASQNDCKISDIVRTAVVEFIARNPSTASANQANPLTAHRDGREAAINQGLLPRTSAPRTPATDRRSPSGDNLPTPQTQPYNLTNSTASPHSPSHNAPTKRMGMKDKLNSL